MAKKIATLEIGIVANSAGVKTGMADAEVQVRKSSQAMSREMRAQSTEAKHSLELLGEEFGVHLPRGVRIFAASLDSVRTVAAGLFTGLGLVGLGEVAFEAGKKLHSLFDQVTGFTDLHKQAEAATAAAAKALADETKQIEALDKAYRQLHMSQAQKFADDQREQQEAIQRLTRQQFENERQQALIKQRLDEANQLNDQHMNDVATSMGEIPSGAGLVAASVEFATRNDREALRTLVAQHKELSLELNHAASAAVLFGGEAEKAIGEEATKAARDLNAELEKGIQLMQQVDAAEAKVGQDAHGRRMAEIDDEIGKLKQSTELNAALSHINAGKTSDLENQKELERQAQAADKLSESLKNIPLPPAFDEMPKLAGATTQSLDTVDLGARDLSATISQDVKYSFENAFAGIISGTESVSQAFSHMAESIVADLARMIFEQTIWNAISGFFGGGLTGGLSPGDLAAPGIGLNGPAVNALIGAPHAMGGPVSAGVAYPVGEMGPEMFVPSSSGTILPNGGSRTQLTQIFDFRNAVGLDQATIARVVDQASQRGAAMAISAIDERGRRR